MTTLSNLISLDSTLGVFFLAGIFSTCLWGMGCIQLYYYYEVNSSIDEEKKENRWIKPYTFVVWILDTVHQGFFMESTYKYFVTNYGNLLYLARIDKTIIYMGMGSAVIDAMCQFFFVMRAWKLSDKNRVLTATLIIAVMAQLSVTLAYAGQAVHFKFVPQLVTTIATERAMNVVWVVADTFIAVVMVYLLRRLESNSDYPGFDLRMRKSTYSVLRRLISYTIGTGLVTGVVGVIAFIGSELLPQSLIYMVSDLILPKLYLNCLLASLNVRVGLREVLARDVECASIGPMFADTSRSAGIASSEVVPLPSHGIISIKIDTEVLQGSADRNMAGTDHHYSEMTETCVSSNSPTLSSEVDIDAGRHESTTSAPGI